MSQILKTRLTPEKLFPKFAALFDYIVQMDISTVEYSLGEKLVRQKSKELGIDIFDFAKCAVAESYGFSDNYKKCKICAGYSCGGVKDTISFAALFADITGGYTKEKDWRDSDTVKGFLQHFFEQHLI